MSQIAPAAPTDPDAVDWHAWQGRWDRQQAGYLPDREGQFALLLDVVERLIGAPARLVDLACGPGSIAARAGRAFPAAEVIGIDLDPFLLELARRTVASDRIRFAEADLREPGWDDVLGDAPIDAVCSATALHYLAPAKLSEVAEVLGRRMRPGGVFVNVDTMRLGPGERPRLDQLAVDLRQHIWDGSHADGIEDWASWWAAAREVPAFAGLVAERDRRLQDRWQGPAITLTDMHEAFRKAGFAETGILAQVADKHTFVAIR
jgi:SAM-dependent methyltransferase